jgi:hypothetical protein
MADQSTTGWRGEPPEPGVSYRVSITRTDLANGASAKIEWGDYGLLGELLTDLCEQVDQFGWLEPGVSIIT